jgi:hypothetical protein
MNVNLSEKEEGYLINLELFTIYENLKNLINGNISNNNILLNINPIEFKSSRYLLNMIYNDNKYIIVNKDIWTIICNRGKENEQHVYYRIDDTNLIIFLKKEKIYFLRDIKNKNIIKKSLLVNNNYDFNYDEINQIYKNIKEYYEFENNFLNELKKGKESSGIKKKGNLVNKKWFDEWKLYTNYDKIKNI